MPDELTPFGPGLDLLDRVADLVRAHQATDPETSHERALRIWAGLLGLTSLCTHRPGAPWATTALQDAAALLESLQALPQSR